MSLPAEIEAAARPHGLAVAALDLAPEEAWRGARGVAMLASDGRRMWAAFQAAPEARDGRPHPLDRWSARIAGSLAARFGADPVLPSEGPPFAPFLAWAERAEPVWPSAIGLTLHAERGLWASWRAALAFPEPFGIGPAPRGPRPCGACPQPCRTACPVGAFGAKGYDVAACAAHLDRPEGADCRAFGCRARRACPVGAAAAPAPDQAAFHIAAFRAARSPAPR